ncbi:unnamed protein product [Linum tenue]|uniref:Uncharacterized protein n=2 Tax=Linum tenue TaxID=586396 RepID=A0AAV0R7Z3_9ROSI|nr:unnamed protein product [Linum tenue]
MAAATSSSCSSPVFVVAAITLFLLVASCSATRPGAVLIMKEGPKSPEDGRKHYLTAFQYEGQAAAAAFNFLPKGVPIPPSGPSKRHNSIEN